MPEKTNEITAIPELLDQLTEAGQLKGALVTIDAMGTQTEIAETIIAHEADYLLPLKGNQPTLETEVESYFSTAPAKELVTEILGIVNVETDTVEVNYLGLDAAFSRRLEVRQETVIAEGQRH